ncbi:3D domain-containing protein [Collimonas sp.]|jgi:3D (Asp-Asp-Asp) domain-containing protein|uniref:3D domain-containing protein n=1 Tax=Collimonas sp. TaxID=1963772 RepID=UPI002BE38CB7|nr:3D domain-containing protein [Collimonas sp.]HWW07413.1 3D domain-containing protein [Collimonas sp.]
MITKIILLLAAVWFTAGATAANQEDFSFLPPKDETSAVNLWATHYYVQAATEIGTGVPIRSKSGQALTGMLNPRDWCLGAIEGTIQVSGTDTVKTLNYAGASGNIQVDCAAVLKIDPKRKPWISSVGKSYFTAAKGPFGDGVSGFILVPYRTIAVDPSRIPFGTALYIPKAKGVEVTVVPGKTIRHDGYFFAADTGGAIKGQHIDVFCGATAENCFPAFITSDDTTAFKAVVVTDASVISKLKNMHKP